MQNLQLPEHVISSTTAQASTDPDFGMALVPIFSPCRPEQAWNLRPGPGLLTAPLPQSQHAHAAPKRTLLCVDPRGCRTPTSVSIQPTFETFAWPG